MNVRGLSSPPQRPTHTVKAGDGWWQIANDNHVPLNDLLTANGATLNTVIHPGDRLFLPEGRVAGASVTTIRPLVSTPTAVPSAPGRLFKT
jgi:LysM repeat protein